MVIDLLIVDDYQPGLDSLAGVAENDYGLETVCFTSGLAALNYLQRTPYDQLPRGYLIDMRLDPELKNRSELESPVNIFKYLQERYMIKYFRFITGNISGHDLRVAEETGVFIIPRYEIVEVDNFFKKLAKTSPNPRKIEEIEDDDNIMVDGD